MGDGGEHGKGGGGVGRWGREATAAASVAAAAAAKGLSGPEGTAPATARIEAAWRGDPAGKTIGGTLSTSQLVEGAWDRVGCIKGRGRGWGWWVDK